MNHRQRFLAFANFEPVDRIPRYAGFIDDLNQRIAAKIGTSELTQHFDMDVAHGAGLTTAGQNRGNGCATKDGFCLCSANN